MRLLVSPIIHIIILAFRSIFFGKKMSYVTKMWVKVYCLYESYILEQTIVNSDSFITAYQLLLYEYEFHAIVSICQIFKNCGKKRQNIYQLFCDQAIFNTPTLLLLYISL